MRYFFSAILLLLSVSLSALPPVKWNQRYQNYIDRYKDIAIYEMLTYNIPASITLAQGLLESGAGSSELCVKGNNHFGIKCHNWTGPTMTHDDDYRGECFRVYESAFDSYEDHSHFLQRQRYQRLFMLKHTDYVGWANGLKACGYATNPRYAQSLIEIIRCYHLDQFDRATSYDVANLQRVSGKRDVVAAVADSGGPLEPSPINGFAHNVMMNNQNYYVVAHSGDTFKSIGKEFEVSYRKLAKYNERSTKTVLAEGEIVYLEKKRSKASKEFKGKVHVVRKGESMYSIAQEYGIRLKSLYKKNGLPIDHTLYIGERLKVY